MVDPLWKLNAGRLLARCGLRAGAWESCLRKLAGEIEEPSAGTVT